jgi:hypothetical protein
VIAAKIAGDGIPIEELGMERAVVSPSQRRGEDLLCPFPRSRMPLFQPRVCLTQSQNVEEVGRGRGIDVAGVLLAAMVEKHDGRQPDDVQLADTRLSEIEAQGNERLGDGGDHGGVWIHHGIQELTAYSVILLDVDQDEPPLPTGMRERRVPIALPGNSRTGYVSQRLR